MLRNQIFAVPIEIAVGPELFYEPNAIGINLEVLRLFQNLSQTVVGVRLSFVANKMHVSQPAQMLDRLQASGIAFGFCILFETSKAEFVRQTLHLFDVLYCPETLANFGQVRGLSVKDRGHFLSCLQTMMVSIVAPSIDLFRN